MLRTLSGAILALVLSLSASLPVLAVSPDEVLSDPALEARARDLSAGLRCMVCQNQSIDDSDAPLAKDIRVLVRERLTAGDTDAQVVEFLVSRYGEFVLLKPRLSWHTLLLWAAGPLALAAGLAAMVVALRRRKALTSAPGGGEPQSLSAEEEARLAEIMKRDNSS